ncbi:hypothetical protein IPH19_03190 [Candidatus Uhrbacteria bacterium]|nr:MAG: hypothetical protein IPH19_03190 [Candidatus Uhrbacteria bacterium]
MTSQNDQRANIVSFRFPVPSKGAAARFSTKRFLYEVQNVEEKPLVEVDDAPAMVLRASVTLRVFHEDYVDSDEKLAEFDKLTPGLNETIRELTHGVYTSREEKLKIMVKGRGGKLEEGKMSAYIVDPARKDGRNALVNTFFMNEMLQAASGDDRMDRIMRRHKLALRGQRVDKRVVSGASEDAVNASFLGWVYMAEPRVPTVDYEQKTAIFNSYEDIGFAVYMPLSMIRVIANLYYKILESRWRKTIEEDHEIVAGSSKEIGGKSRLLLPAGRQVQKERKAEAQQPAADQTSKPKRDRKPRGSRKDTSEVKTEGETAAEAKTDSSEPSSPPTAEA